MMSNAPRNSQFFYVRFLARFVAFDYSRHRGIVGMKSLKRWSIALAFAAVAAAQTPGSIGSIFGPGLAAQLAVADTVPISSFALPQVAFGGGWYTGIYFNNRTSDPLSASVFFFDANGLPLPVPAIGSSTTVTLPPAGTAIVEAPNNGALQQGWARVDAPDGMVGYGVFRFTVPGQPSQLSEGVSPFVGTSTTFSSLIFDDTAYVTSVAFANPSGVSASINIRAISAAGQVIGTATQTLGPGARTAIVLRNVAGLESVAGQRGAVEFSATTGAVSVLGLRFNNLTFTSIPPSSR